MDMTGKGLAVLPLAAGAYALAWAVGLILIPFPGGVGPRELALIAALAPIMTPGAPTVVAVPSRLVNTIADLAWALLAVVLAWRARRARAARGDAGDGGGRLPPPAGHADVAESPGRAGSRI